MMGEKAIGTVAVVAIVAGVGYAILSMMKKEGETGLLVEPLKEKLVYFQDKGDEFRENLEDITTRMDVAKEDFETGLVDVGNKITDAVNTINELREMTGREPSDIDLTKLQEDIARVTGTVIDPIKTVVTEPTKIISERYDDMKSSLDSLQDKLSITLNEPVKVITEPIKVITKAVLGTRYTMR